MRTTATFATIVGLVITTMPLSCWPLMVVRHAGITLMRLDPRATSMEAATAMLKQLTTAEADVVRVAYGQPKGSDIAEWVPSGPLLLYVPEQLRLAGMSALQGDVELERRTLQGNLDREMACLLAGRVVSALDVPAP